MALFFTPVCDVIAQKYKKRQQSYLPCVIYLPSRASVSVNKTDNPLYFQFFGVLIVARFGNLVIMNEKLFITD